MIDRLRSIYREFPSHFWTLVLGVFIDRLGSALIFPFLSLYITARFQVGMLVVGQLFAIFSVASLFGIFLGGALADRFGRKKILIFGLLISGLSSVAMGVANDLRLFFSFAALVGLLSSVGQPAGQAMVADLLPEAKRTQGYGLLRVGVNLAVAIGPAVGGLLAGISYLYLFILDAVLSSITALIVLVALPETKPQAAPGVPSQSLLQTLGGYGAVLRDRLFVLFMLASVLVVMVYIQMSSSLPVYLRDQYAVSERQYGLIISLNAVMVVLFQFWITRRTAGVRPMTLVWTGNLLYGVGYALYGFVGAYPLFLLAMAIITVGEMLASPSGEALVAAFAPLDMRGRYMAFFGFTLTLPNALGPLAAGAIMDNFDPDWVWYASGIVCVVAVLILIAMQGAVERRMRPLESAPVAVGD